MSDEQGDDGLEAGLQALREGRAEEAVRFLEAACANGERGCEAQMYLGVAFAMTGAYDRAVASLERALCFNPRHAGCMYNLGVVYQKKGYRSAAIACYQATLEINSQHRGAQLALEKLGALKPTGKAARQSPRAT